jgi:hypothetical protein
VLRPSPIGIVEQVCDRSKAHLRREVMLRFAYGHCSGSLEARNPRRRTSQRLGAWGRGSLVVGIVGTVVGVARAEARVLKQVRGSRWQLLAG